MSRIGKKTIVVPQGVTLTVDNGMIVVAGPKGTLQQALHAHVSIEQDEEGVHVKVADETNKQQRALWGLYGSLVRNMIEGVVNGYKKELEVNGVGYRIAMKGTDLELSVGFSHPVTFKVPADVTASVQDNRIMIEGIDKQRVGETAAQIRKIKKPEPYLGKGIKYVDEELRRKAGKAASA